MFGTLQDKLALVFRQLGNQGRLTENDVTSAMKDIRLAMLEADVHFKVTRDFVQRVQERAVGQEVLRSVSPGQQVIKIVYEEMTSLLGGGIRTLEHNPIPPTVVMLVGLQGSGKTTTAAKLAAQLQGLGQRSILIAADLNRPAAIDQLATLGQQIGVPVYQETTSTSVVQVCSNGIREARSLGVSWAMLDTGGRLHTDESLMKELREVKSVAKPQEILLVVDALTGQDAVRVAQDFHAHLSLTGLILTKLDGDARGGAALSITKVTGVPIKYIGVGEKPNELEPFHPDRMASRILGMGDILSLVEKAERGLDQEKTRIIEEKIRKATFTLEDFREHLQQLKNLGPLDKLLELLPGFGQANKQLSPEALNEGQIRKIEAIILSMTKYERENPEMINGSRRRRIALGSGTTPQDINRLLNQFQEMRKLMRRLSVGRTPKSLGKFLR